MTSQPKAQLQLAVDVLNTAEALRITEQVYPHFDIVEVGTPLIIEEGLAALEALREQHPDTRYLADLKIMDAGYIEAKSAFERGANLVTVLGVTDNKTIANALKAANEFGGQIMADLINVPDVVARGKELERLGVTILCLHTAYDRQQSGIDPLEELRAVRPAVKCQVAVAGGLGLDTVAAAVIAGANIVVVGGGIIAQPNPREAAKQIHEKIREANR